MILVVEDDRGWETYYRRILKGHELCFCHDGIAAIMEMDEVKPNLVILDVLLTGPTGFAVLNEMRSYPELAKVPVLIVTSVTIRDVLARQYGVIGILDKGKMMPQELLEAVQEALA